MTATSTIPLPSPSLSGSLSVEEALTSRRSVREYTVRPVSLAQAAQLLWAAQGVTDRVGRRTAPSAGGLYPLAVYLVAEQVGDLPAGVYHYVPEMHSLERVVAGSAQGELYRAALSQSSVRDAPAVFVFSGVFERTVQKYGDRGRQYVYMEAGHAAQNVYLQATALGLGTVVIGAFDDDSVKRILGMRGDEEPLYLMPVGRPPSQ